MYGIADYNNMASSFGLVKLDDTSADDTFITYNRKSGINNGTMEATVPIQTSQHGFKLDFRSVVHSVVVVTPLNTCYLLMQYFFVILR